MAIDVTVPQLGESLTEVTISKWRVREGDIVKKDQVLVEVGTDKTDAEIPAPTGGCVETIAVTEGEVVPVHGLLCRIDADAAKEALANAASPPATVVDALSAGAPLATPTARKAALEHGVDLASVRPSDDRGRITRDDVERAAAERPAAQAAAPAAPIAPPRAPAPAPVAAPRTAELAALVNAGGGFVPPVPGTGYGAFKVAPYRPAEGDTIVPYTRRRRITADHMTYSKFASPHVVTVAEVDLHRAARLRDAHKDRYKKEGIGLTMLAFVALATARALRENATMNARVLDDAYVLLKDVNLGVAVDSPDGLVVPVVRRADELGVRGIARSIDELAKRAKTGKITIDELSGASFSLTNPGLKGNLFGGAIINQPNVGILRMGEIQKRVVVVAGPDGDDLMAIHPVMYLALSYDHRVVDGVAANSFLWRVVELLEKAEFEP